MANRLTQIATRTGDDGSTGLGDGSRVPKDHLRIAAMGDVDELNSNLGLLLCEQMPAALHELLIDVQHQLFNLGGELSMPNYELLKDEALAQVDAALAEYNAVLPRLAEFILPAGSRGAAQAHVCRTVARRAERTVVALGLADATVRAAPRQYLNRLSDLMFVLARVFNRMNGGDDVYWKSERLEREQATPAAERAGSAHAPAAMSNTQMGADTKMGADTQMNMDSAMGALDSARGTLTPKGNTAWHETHISNDDA